MIRHAAAVAIVMCLVPSWAAAQAPVLTVKLATANVHKAPSTGSPVIGQAPRGTVLEVTRQLGDWVKVAWTEAPDSSGYVHMTAGTLGAQTAPAAAGPASARTPSRAAYAPARSTSTSTAAPSAALLASDTQTIGIHEHPAQIQSPYVAPPSHVFGLGGRVSGSTLGFGASGRAWSGKRLGLQIDVSRYAITSATVPGRVTSLQFAPSVLYSLPDRVSDYFWLRPYVGGGVNLSRSTQTGFGATNKAGLQAFGGAEVTFASVPRFALSADAGYRQSRAPFDGFETGGVTFSVSGHWYVK